MNAASRVLCGLVAGLCLSLSFAAAPASAGISQWLAEVAAGTPAGYTNTNLAAPIVADIGTYSDDTNGGVTYELIVNATNDGDSSALIGTFANPAVADRAAIKWEQWQNSTHYGATAFGVADYDSGVVNTPGVDTHLAFISNGADMLLYVNGALAGTMAGASIALSGTVGIGQAYNPDGPHVDPLTGTIHGIAVYDAALSPNEIAAHVAAFRIPEPTSTALLILAFGGAAMFRRKK